MRPWKATAVVLLCGFFWGPAGLAEGPLESLRSRTPVHRKTVASEIQGPEDWVPRLSKDRSALTLQIIEEQAIAFGEGAVQPLIKGFEAEDTYLHEACMTLLHHLHEAHPKLPLSPSEEEAIQAVLAPYETNGYRDMVEVEAGRLKAAVEKEPELDVRDADLSLVELLLRRAKPRERIELLFDYLDVYEPDALKQMDKIESPDQLGLCYLHAKRVGRADLAEKFMRKLDKALGPPPKRGEKWSVHGFPAEVGVGRFSGDVSLLASGSESGQLHIFLLRKSHIVPVIQYPLPGGYIRNRPWVAGTRVFVGTQSRSSGDVDGLYCVDAATGETVWQARIGEIRYANPLLWRDKLYVTTQGSMHFEGGSGKGHGDSGLYCLERDTGKVLWYLPIEQMSGDNSPVPQAGKLRVFCPVYHWRREYKYVEVFVDPDTGQLLDARPRGEQPKPRVRFGEKIFELRQGPDPRRDSGHGIACLDASTQEEIWFTGCDVYECVGGEYEPFDMVDGFLFVGRACVDLTFKGKP